MSINGNVFSQGDRTFGVLGLGWDMKQHDSFKKINLPQISQISSKYMHTFALDENRQQIYCWGLNTYGALGLGHTHDAYEPKLVNLSIGKILSVKCGQYHTAVLTDTYELFFSGQNEDKQLGFDLVDDVLVFTKFLLVSAIVSVECGHRCTIFLTLGGDVYLCGRISIDSEISQLTKLNLSDVLTINLGLNHFIVETKSGTYGWGSNEEGQLNLIDARLLM